MSRFINLDALIDSGAGLFNHNMFAYCENNPVMMYDPSGRAAYWLKEPSFLFGLAGHSAIIVSYGGGVLRFF